MRRLLSLLAAIALLAIAPTAQAATVSYDPVSGDLRIAAAPAEANALTVTQTGPNFTITATGAPLTASLVGGCRVGTGGEVTCVVPAATRVDVALADGDDTASAVTEIPFVVAGGDGDDVLTGGPAGDALSGDAGADVLDGAEGHDAYAAGDGDDQVLAEDGKKEVVACGAGTDTGRADADDTLSDCEIVAIAAGKLPPGSEDPKDDTGNRNGGDEDGDGVRDEVPAGSKVAVPVPGRSVGVDVKEGVILVRRPGTAKAAPLDPAVPVPVGSVLDARHGTLTLTSAASAGATQTADFTGSKFIVSQRPGTTGTELKMTGGDFSVCSAPSARSRTTARAAAKRKRVRRLWGSGHGRFTTRGRNSSATVRGTIWSVEDRCNGTLTRVKRGVVVVTDFARERTKVVRAGQSYFARRR